MITKNTILITSLGRTGTEFFAKFFAHLIPGCTSLHEPDVVQFVGVKNKLSQFSQQVRQAGILRMILGKITGQWSLIKISDERFINRISNKKAAEKLHAQRYGFIQGAASSIYVEANIGYYGLLDIIPAVFQNHKSVFIIRDGREWIRSHMNWGEFYGKTGIRKMLSHNWPSAASLPQDYYASKWKHLSRFEKLCWAWSRLNEYALTSLDKNPNARIFQFENLFLSEGKYQTLNDLISFTTFQPGIDPTIIGNSAGWLESKTHQSSGRFPAWKDWTLSEKEFFKNLCGPLMTKLGYS